MEQEELDKISPEYLSAFNQGYELTQQMPELAHKLAKSIPDNERGKGFKDGLTQYLLEKTKDQLREKGAAKDIDRGIEPTLEIQPER